MHRLYDVQSYINDISKNQRDATYKFGKKCIDSISVSIRVISKVESVKMTECSEIVTTDY